MLTISFLIQAEAGVVDGGLRYHAFDRGLWQTLPRKSGRCNSPHGGSVARAGLFPTNLGYVMSQQPDRRLDASGLNCPLPLLKAKQALADMQAGQLLEVVATDAGSWRDFESFVEHSRHTLVGREENSGVYHYWLRKADGEARA